MSNKNVKPEVHTKQLTVKELIELLQLCPMDALVWHEGCDCWGEADRVEYDDEDNTVLIGRNSY